MEKCFFYFRQVLQASSFNCFGLLYVGSGVLSCMGVYGSELEVV